MINSKRLKPGAKRTTVRMTPDDERLLQELKSKTGVVSTSDLLRNGLRKLAQAEGLR